MPVESAISQIVINPNPLSDQPWYKEPQNVIDSTVGFLTFVLALITAWNVWETRKAVQISEKQYGITSRPYLTFVSTKWGAPPTEDLTLFIPIKNTGSTPANYTVKKCQIDDTDQMSTEMQPCVFQNQEIPYFIKFLDKKEGTHKILVEIEYWPIENNSLKFIRRRILKVDIGKKGPSIILEDFAN